MDVRPAAIDGRQAHDSLLAHLCTEEGAVEVPLHRLGRAEVVAHFLIGGVLFQHISALDGVQLRLLGTVGTVQVGKCPPLLLQLNLTHELDGLLARVERLGIERADAVDL